MQIQTLQQLFEANHRRYHIVGNIHAGVLIGLDLEGRLFTILEGKVLNRVNPAALTGLSSGAGYLNPGGDGLWPAPEGSRLGYEYAAGQWRVPPGLTNARYQLIASDEHHASVRAEVDLINASGLGVPMAFERHVQVAAPAPRTVTVTVKECLEYLGTRPLAKQECLAAPWTLAQFDCEPGAEVVFPGTPTMPIHDFYEPSAAQRHYDGQLWHTRTDGGPKYQIALEPPVDWIEFRHPKRCLRVRRTAEPLPSGLSYIDIADRSPESEPLPLAVRFSVYSDPSKFMEIEAAGGVPDVMHPGSRTALVVTTVYQILS